MTNFIHKDNPLSDRELFFGSLTPEDTFIEFDSTWIMADIMVAAKVFKSKSEAKKNGWNKSVAAGFTHLIVGKNKKLIYILNFIEKSDETNNVETDQTSNNVPEAKVIE